MWRSGAERRRREGALAAMLAQAERYGDLEQPWRHYPQIWALFRDEADILRTLQAQWWTELAGAVYLAIEQGDGNLCADVRSAYRKIAKRYHRQRAVLEANAEHPAIAAAMRKERALLSSFSGVLSSVTAAA